VRSAIIGISVVVVGALVLLTGRLGDDNDAAPAFALPQVDGLRLPARVEVRFLEAATRNGFEPRFWAGVNLGSTIPGRQPGEVAATRQDYDRWLSGIDDLGARVIRIYTILRPSFYDALAAHNRTHADRPLYFIQGVWVPDEDEFVASGNAYEPSVTNGFKAEIDDATAVVHGDAELPRRPGHAHGTYRSNVSRWLLAYSIGIEWDGNAVRSTDRLNAGVERFRGRYLRADANATPMESWLASMLDHTAAGEAARGWSRPLTFTNWLTLDPLEHPYEPLPREDLVSLDASHIRATRAWPGGFFASYHAYPYYPDFMRLTPSYQTYKRPRDGKVDPYSGYLNALRSHHADQAVMITEFGVPSSLGVAHRGPLGRDQGDHSEQEALRMDADMLRGIEEEDYAGGIVFAWIDEWFKITWNTVEFELPSDRRQLWRNDLTNEEFFGVIAAEPGSEPAVVLDGKDDEWDSNGSELIAESDGPVREVRAVKDEQYLYLRLRLDQPESWRERPITVGLDIRPGGNRGLPNHPGVFPSADAALVIERDQAQLFQAAWWEPTRLQYGPLGAGYIDVDRDDLKPDSGAWVHPLQILNRPYVVPATGERRPVEVHELGNLPFGSGDPSSPDFDSRTLVAAQGNVVEVRLPWALLGYADPSSLMLLEVHPKGPATTLKGGRVGIAVLSDGSALLTTTGYSWEPWQRVNWHERRKAGFDQLASTMRQLSAP
jgi:hypothetical protein